MSQLTFLSAEPPANRSASPASDAALTIRAALSCSHTVQLLNAIAPVGSFGLRSDASRDGVAKTPSADAEGNVRLRDPGFSILEECAPTIDAGQPHTVATQWAVRRLTPKECERLQGAPDDWTNITRKGKPIADGPRYKMVGNSMAVPVMSWIGERIALVDAQIYRPLLSKAAAE